MNWRERGCIGCLIVVAGIMLGAAVVLLSGCTPFPTREEMDEDYRHKKEAVIHTPVDSLGVACYFNRVYGGGALSCVKVR